MGKTVKKDKGKKYNGIYEFEVLVRVHGKTHTERYSIVESDYSRAKSLGYFDTSGDNQVYYDWKPLFRNKSGFQGGIIDVSYYTFDDKYAYAHLDDGEASFSLPKYLFDKMEYRTQILVGKRTY